MRCGGRRDVVKGRNCSSDATNHVANDTNGSHDIFLRDIVLDTTERISTGPGGAQANDWSYEPTISLDGSAIVFYSSATNLVANDTNGLSDAFVRTRVAGVTTRVSVDSAGQQGNASIHWRPDLSSDGQYVAFTSYATNLVPSDTNNKRDVFVRRLW